MVAINLNENAEWISFVRNQIEPIAKLQKGKLCQDHKDGDRSRSDASDNNIFDDDFMRSNFQIDDPVQAEPSGNFDKLGADFNIDGLAPSKPSEGQKGLKDRKLEGQDYKIEEDEEDHQKFFKKMQECFSSNLNRRMKGTDHVDNNERDMKTLAYTAHAGDINDDLRASLSD